MRLKLEETFEAWIDQLYYTQNELLGLKVKQSTIKAFANHLNLFYVENIVEGGNACHMNAKTLQTAYKMYFSKNDLIDYISSVLNTDLFDFSYHVVQYPNRDIFLNIID